MVLLDRVVFVAIVLYWTRNYEVTAEFYKGCSNSFGTGKEYSVEQNKLPFSCIRLCIIERFSYAAVQNGSRCLCFKTVQTWANTSSCDISCPGNSNLYCGGTSFKSVYSTDLPTVASVNIPFKLNIIPTDTKIELKAKVSVYHIGNDSIYLQSIQGMNKSLDKLYVTWKLNDNVESYSNYSLVGNTTNIEKSIHLPRPGMFKLCVEIKNLVSEMTECRKLEALQPVSGIRLVDIKPRQNLFVNKQNASLLKAGGQFSIKVAVKNGSKAEFKVSFGDNSMPFSLSSNKLENAYILGPTCVTAWHIYSICGNYTIQVDGSNPVSNVSVSLPVRVEQTVTFVSLPTVSGLPGQQVKLQVKVEGRFCKIMYNWTIEGKRITTEEPFLKYIFNETKSHIILVNVFNHISSYTARGVVHIKTQLLPSNVSLVIEGSRETSNYTVRMINQDVTFRATMEPHVKDIIYDWYFNGQRRQSADVENKYQIYNEKFNEPASYSIYVVARSSNGTVSSNVVQLYIEEPIYQVELEHEGVIRAKQSINFTAIVNNKEESKNFKVHWDFGDGNTATTMNTQAIHTYQKTGLYNIKVMVYNNVSSLNDSTSIYFTTMPSCQPPSIKIIGRNFMKSFRHEELYLESQVKLDCTWSKVTLVYEWKVIPFFNEPVKTNKTIMTSSETLLIIPPYTLTHGVFAIILKVHINTTVLSTERTIQVAVEKDDLIANIKGGTMRVVGYTSEEPLVLDGSESIDPDFPKDFHQLKFNWTCHLLYDNTTSCFHSKVKTDSPVLKISTKQLLPGKDAFIVSLTVSKPGKKSKSTWQVLRMVNASPHLLSLHCPQCDKDTVNYNDELVLHGHCSTCPWNTNKDITFEWQLYLVNDNPDPMMKPDKCKPGRIQLQKSSRGAPTKMVTSLPVTQIVFPTRGTRPPIVQERGRINRGSVCNTPIFKPTVLPTMCRVLPTKLSRRNLRYGNIFICSTLSPTSKSVRVSPGPGGHGSVTPGMGSATISHRSPSSSGNTVTHPVKPTTQTPTSARPKPTKSNGQTDSLYDPDFMIPEASKEHHILGIKRSLFLLPASWTKTGINNRNFVLNKGNLVSGEMYMVALKVHGRDKVEPELRRGMASVFFTVNDNPDIGQFTVAPGLGIEIETRFKIKCTFKEGKNNDVSRYHVTYKIQGDQQQQEGLIYSGKNTEPTFILPAGLPRFGFNVSLFISAFNTKGTAIEICPLTLRVKPRVIKNSLITDEEYLLNKTRDEYMKNLIKLGEEQQVKQLVKVLAKALNRLDPVKNTTSKFYLRRETRLELLKIVRKWKILDMISAVHTTEALDVITRVASELNSAGLETASQLLSEAESKLIKEGSIKPSGPSSDVVNLMTRVVSNMLSASHSISRSDIPKHKNIHHRLVKIVQTALKSKLKKRVLGEREFKIVQPMLSAVASQSIVVSQSRWALNNVMFLLPPSIKDYIRVDSQTYAAACIGTTMVVYEDNPYTWSRPNELSETKASSLMLSSCSGQPIEIHDLKEEVEMNLPWRHQKANSPQNESIVKWKSLNIHNITRGKSVDSHSLKLTIQILSVLDHGMVLRIVVSLNTAEDIANSSIFRTIVRGNITLMLTSKDLINASDTIRVGVIMEDMSLNRIKKVFNATPAKYSISSNWIGCYYWDEKTETWSTHGCYSTEKTTDTYINCRCNHLTMFVGKAFWTPNPLNPFPKDIEKLKNNYIPLVLLVFTVVLYVILLCFCYKMDLSDAQKRGVIFLTSLPSRRSYRYKITIETGHWFGSGTTATVVMRMFGEVNTSDPIELVAEDKPLFKRGSKDVFIFDSTCDLSPVWKIHVWHYNDGDSPSWYLNRVVVQDMASNDKWYFDAFRWLAVDEEDGKVDVELMPLGTKNNVVKRHYHHITQYLLDYHLWLSVWGRPSTSNFNHKQRLTCCLSLVLTFLSVNAAWFRTKSIGARPFEILGLLDTTWETVVYGVLCGLIAMPVNLLWILMFRYSKPKAWYKSNVAPVPYDDPITETSCILNGTEYNEDSISILDQTIETFLYLKALGRKVKPFSSYWDDKSSLDSVFETFEGKSFSFSSASDLQTVIPTKPPPSPIQNVPLSRGVPQVITLESKRGYFLPFWFVYIAWIGCAMTIVVTSYFTVVYGLSFGPEKCIIWVQSLCFSLIESLFISQPLMVIAIPIYAMCSKWASRSKSKVAPLSEDNQDKAEELRAKKNDNYMNMSLKAALEARRRQRYLKFLKPLSKTALSDASEKQHVRNVFFDYIRDFLTVVVLLILVSVLVSGMYCGAAFTIKDTVQRTILKHSSNEQLSDRGRLDQWWKNNQENIVDLLYWKPNEWALDKNKTAQIFFKGTSSILVGRPRIRQYKTTAHKVCSTASVSGINETAWTRKCWTRCITDEGQWSTVELSRTKSNAEAELRQLSSTDWISICTNHIAIEFVLYAPTLNVFSVVTWEVRGKSSDLSYTHIQVNTIKDVTSNAAMDIFLKLCKVLFVFTFIFCLYNEIVCFVRIKLKYFKSIWKVIKVCCLALSAMSIIAYMYWSVAVYTLIREILSEGRDDVVTAGMVVYRRQETLISLYAMILFLVVLKVIHLLRVFKFVQRFCVILWTAFGSICALMVILLLAIVMLSHFGYLLFCRNQEYFKSFSTAFIHVSGFLRHKGNDHLRAESEMLSFSIVYLFSCTILLLVILRGLSMAILNWSLHSTKRKHLPTHLLVNFLSNLWYSFMHKKVEEESDDEDDDFEDELEDKGIIPVEYACDEVEFQMEELLFKMNNLVGEGGLADLRLSSSSDLLLSSDEYEDDVEYLYRQENSGHLMVAELGSGYESDQSFFSVASGSMSQEGLTDLELQRRISKDSSVLTSEMHPYDLKEMNKLFEMNVDTQNQARKCQQPRDANVHPRVLYRTKSFLSQTNESQEHHPTEIKTENDALQSGTYGENRRASLTKTKEKHHLLTRKPKLRQGQLSLDDIPKDICLASSSSTYPEGSTSSEEDKFWARGIATEKTATPKKPSYMKTLLSKGSVSPMNDCDDRPNRMDGVGPSQRSSSNSSNERHINEHHGSYFDKNRQRSSALLLDRRCSTDAPLSPSEPGIGNDGYYEDKDCDNESRFSDDEMVPLPGLVGDICMNKNISTHIH